MREIDFADEMEEGGPLLPRVLAVLCLQIRRHSLDVHIAGITARGDILDIDGYGRTYVNDGVFK